MPNKTRFQKHEEYSITNRDTFRIARAQAIHDYASVELSLNDLFASLLGSERKRAGLVFFRITSSHARSRILDDLKQEAIGNDYSDFWKSLLSFARTLDQKRHEIVHWQVIEEVDLTVQLEKARFLTLRPPLGWSEPTKIVIQERDLLIFSGKCRFLIQLIRAVIKAFESHVVGSTVPPAVAKIISSKIEYPPPNGHPYARMLLGENPPLVRNASKKP